MKTLVLHPKDLSTDFLSKIYIDKDWNIITNINISKKDLIINIKNNDRIIMLGHGTSEGLLAGERLIIDSNLVYLLRNKECICIWCYAKNFFDKYKLKGFATGMIISEVLEADFCGIINAGIDSVNESNNLFSETIKKNIDEPEFVKKLKEEYKSEINPIIKFNQENI